MTHSPLDALLRLRRLTADQARHDLADCLRAETEAAEALAAIKAAIVRETEVATDLATGDAEVEAFAAWLRRIRPTQRTAETAVEATAAETSEARAALAMARAAVRAVEETLARHTAAERALAERQAQRELDEAARHQEGADVLS